MPTSSPARERTHIVVVTNSLLSTYRRDNCARVFTASLKSFFAPTGRVRLSFAVRDGERVATLFHFTCGDRVVESYGGMTDAGADARANYLLKWAAIAQFAGEGFRVYDMWGLATGGIRQFKEGFGGEEIEYVGARDLPLRAPIDAAVRVAVPLYGLAQRARLRLMGRGSDDPAAEGV